MRYLKSYSIFNEEAIVNVVSDKLDNMEYYKQIVEIINQKLSKIKPGFVRLWRGNRPNEVGKNPSYTNSLEGIALPFYYSYFEKGKNSVLSYIDITEDEAKKYLTSGSAKDSEFMLPKEILNRVQIVNKNIYQDFENKNLSKTDIEVGAGAGVDDAFDNLFANLGR